MMNFAGPAPTAVAPVQITMLQLNDVYEMTIANGGLARVATLLGRLKAENPNTLAIMAGDLFSPSAIGTAKVDGRPLAGRQMVAVIGDSANTASIRLHETSGFRHVGTLREVGYKFDRWLDVVYMQLPLRPDDRSGPE